MYKVQVKINTSSNMEERSMEFDSKYKVVPNSENLKMLFSLCETMTNIGFDYTDLYCNFGNFHENFIFMNKVKRHICRIKKSRLWHDLPTSVSNRVILPFHEGFIFTKTLCL